MENSAKAKGNIILYNHMIQEANKQKSTGGKKKFKTLVSLIPFFF